MPVSVGLIPWALVTGVAMVNTGFTPIQAMGMNVLVFAGAAQLGTLPLIAAGLPLWIIVLTALALNLRFIIFSAAISKGFRGFGLTSRWLAGYLLTDGVFATCVDKMLKHNNPHWRMGYYFAPCVWSWLLWQVFAGAGIAAAGAIPGNWSLEFMATIALFVLVVPMTKARPMLIAALCGGACAVGLSWVPLRLGLIVAIVVGIAAGMLAEQWQHRHAQEHR